MILIFIIFILNLCSNEEYFLETFEGEDIKNRWIESRRERYNGSIEIEVRIDDVLNTKSKGLVTKSVGSFHGISTEIDFVAGKKEFVLQYEHKFQEIPFECGGSYIKLLNQKVNPLSFDHNSPYVILFGPDRCGGKTKLFFIYRKANPLSHIWTEHILKNDIKLTYNKLTHLFTLIIRDDDTFQIKIDNEIKMKGSLHDRDLFDPPFEPEKEFPDPTAEKPFDWVDEAEIPDENDVKPSDWDENSKGEWKPKMIPNPAFKGRWKPENIKNEHYYKPVDLYKIGHIYGVGLDILQSAANQWFDNIFIGSSSKEASDVAKKYWLNVHKAELKNEKQKERNERVSERKRKLKTLEENDFFGKIKIWAEVIFDWGTDNLLFFIPLSLIGLMCVTVFPIYVWGRCVNGPPFCQRKVKKKKNEKNEKNEEENSSKTEQRKDEKTQHSVRSESTVNKEENVVKKKDKKNDHSE